MSAAVCLVLFSVAVIVLAPPVLIQLTRDGHAPRWSVAAWLVAIGSVLIAWTAAVVDVVVDVLAQWTRPLALEASCLHHFGNLIGGHAGIGSKIVLLSVAAVAAIAAAAISVRWAQTMIRASSRSDEHAQAVRLVGRRTGATDVVLVDSTEPAAYCVTGSPAAIVVTTAAIKRLDDRELDAVLAHERAHLAGQHARIVAALRSLAAIFPFVPLISRAAREVPPLLEMCADDSAVRRHGNPALVSGLITLAGAAPAGALGAADLAVLTRIQRLISPPSIAARLMVLIALAGTLAFLAVGPLLTTALMTLANALGCAP